MKKEFIFPVLEILQFDAKDIITTSINLPFHPFSIQDDEIN